MYYSEEWLHFSNEKSCGKESKNQMFYTLKKIGFEP